MARYAIASGWELAEMAPCGRNRFLVSGNGRYFQVGGLAARILFALSDASKTSNELQEKLSNAIDPSFTNQQVEECISKLLSYGILSDGTNDTAVPEGKSRSKWFGHRYFAVRVPLLPPRLIYPITRRMAALYSPFWIAIICPVLLFLHLSIWLYIYFDHAAGIRFQWPGGPAATAIILGNYAGLLWHELGHAAACVRCKIKHGTIGIGLYLIFPAFYTDVSEAWKLSRSQRMAVDAAGIYTTLILSSASLALFVTTHHYAFLVLTMLYDLTVLMNLNPFIRMDSYWLLSDALEISNLMAFNKEMTVWFLRRICRLPAQRPALLAPGSKLRATLLCYYAASVVFAALLISRLFVAYVPHYAAAIPANIANLKIAFQVHGLGSDAAARALQIVLSSAPLLGVLLYVARNVSKFIRFINEESR